MYSGYVIIPRGQTADDFSRSVRRPLDEIGSEAVEKNAERFE